MATITEDPVRTSDAQLFEEAVSSAILIANTVVLTNPVSNNLSHCFVSVQFFDVSGDPATPTAGTVAITVKTLNSEKFEAVSGSPITASAPVTLNFAANVSEIQAVPTGLDVANNYKLFVTANGR